MRATVKQRYSISAVKTGSTHVALGFLRCLLNLLFELITSFREHRSCLVKASAVAAASSAPTPRFPQTWRSCPPTISASSDRSFGPRPSDIALCVPAACADHLRPFTPDALVDVSLPFKSEHNDENFKSRRHDIASRARRRFQASRLSTREQLPTRFVQELHLTVRARKSANLHLERSKRSPAGVAATLRVVGAPGIFPLTCQTGVTQVRGIRRIQRGT